MQTQYRVHRSIRGKPEVFRLEQGDAAHAEVIPEWGNNCFEFHTTQPVLESVEFENFAQRPQSFGIPILFPFPNRIKDGTFVYADKTYQVNPKQHGFVRDKKWQTLDNGASESEGAWILSEIDAANYAQEILEQFPFPFSLKVLYRLRDGRLTMETVVENVGTGKLPFGFAIHPYFRLPESGQLSVPAQKRWELKEFIPTGTKLNVEGNNDLRQPRDIRTLAMDDIFTDLVPLTNDSTVRCTLKDTTNRIRTIVEFNFRQFPNVVIYNAPLPRRAICIEPYTCPTDAFNLQNRGIDANVLELDPNEKMNFQISIYTEETNDSGKS